MAKNPLRLVYGMTQLTNAWNNSSTGPLLTRILLVQGDRERQNPLFDSQQSSSSQKSARTTADPTESASSRFRSLFRRRDRADTS